MLPTVATSAARTITWSGYIWDVRPAGTAQGPGPNDWSDSTANVQVQGSDLLLSIVKNSAGNWTSSEIDNQQHLGYGTYRWVVDTDLSALDANEVLGMFTYGGSDPSNNEIDIEPSHWGDLLNPSGSVTVWQNANAGLSEERYFSYSPHPPYVNQFIWSPGRIDYLITDATGATLLAWTVSSGVPIPSIEVPVINYWRYHNVAPAGVRTMRISSFAWAPLGQSLTPVTGPPGNLSPATSSPSPPGPAVPGTKGTLVSPPGSAPARPRGPAVSCVIGPQRASVAGTQPPVRFTLAMPVGRFARTKLVYHGVINWSATGIARIELTIRRWVRGAGLIRVGDLRRTVRRGKGVFHLLRSLGGHAIRPGRYSVLARANGHSARCTPGRLRFTVT